MAIRGFLLEREARIAHDHIDLRRRLVDVREGIVREFQDGRIDFVPVPDSEFEIKADLVLLAMGFTGPERGPLLTDLGVTLTPRGNVGRDASWMTNVPGVFTAGDMQRGQSLIVWAIAEGRSAAHAVDKFLMGDSDLPEPVSPGALPLAVV